ncbi:uncharacterized protein LOC124185314 isoform X1 [Neodiprion fabricii]|uniref:uncharacterized protein LOC124185314 isoform X1 n=1 Tax=Neodiprion fabricii TaxID=2872261 RepID=UPI001ED8D646|nr:uncharacterized protein LOC124185314 isoform X1 [Neodiprion fabricii]
MEDFNEGVDGKLAYRMRKVNSEQFHTLVRMHLSFELDLNTEDSDCVAEKVKLKKWSLISFSKKPKSTINLQKEVIEGAPLSHEGITQVKQLIEYLSTEQSIVQEGIFRRTGKLTRQQDLKNALYQGIRLNFEDGQFSVHDCASVLKSFLAELPEPLLTDLHYPAHCQIAELWCGDMKANECRLLRSLQLLLLLLPSENRILLRYVLRLLNKTASFEHSNKMNCDSLATLFTPHLLCPRKLSPEALHINSQTLSGLVAFMITKGIEMFDIPPKLATDIRAYWVEQERKLLSPTKNDLNESISDATGTAHTVFSFVDHKLTAKANSTQDTQAALAQLYAHIQAMPESAKKRRLVKQFNKENGQGTPRQVKNLRTKSLGDSIKKHIFQKKILGHKKPVDINIGCSNITRSSSEENILSSSLEKSLLPPKTLFSKSDDELSPDIYEPLEADNLLHVKHISSSTGSLNTSNLGHCKSKKKMLLANFINISAEKSVKKFENAAINKSSERVKESFSQRESDKNSCPVKLQSKASNLRDINTSKNLRFSRQLSEPESYSTEAASNMNDSEFVRQNSDPIFPVRRRPNIEVVFPPRKSMPDIQSEISPQKTETSVSETSSYAASTVLSRFCNTYTARTSTPAKNLLRKSLAAATAAATANECTLTPIAYHDKSMSPITQSTTKMSKAMQETMMTPRSRKPVMMISGSNLCNLATLNNGCTPCSSGSNIQRSNLDLTQKKSCTSILEECQKIDSMSGELVLTDNQGNTETKENFGNLNEDRNFVTSIEDEYCNEIIEASSVSITSTFREYLLSRSVLTASPVDLSFTSRTDDFDQSESDLNILNEDRLSDSLLHCLDGNQPSSDTSGIVSGSTNSVSNSPEKIDEVINQSPRKRGTNLQRDDSKKSVTDKKVTNELKFQTLWNKQLSESTLKPLKAKETLQETSF